MRSPLNLYSSQEYFNKLFVTNLYLSRSLIPSITSGIFTIHIYLFMQQRGKLTEITRQGISVDMHAFLHKSRKENHRRVVFTQQDMIYLHAHLVLTNLLITSLLVLCFPNDFFCFCLQNFF